MAEEIAYSTEIREFINRKNYEPKIDSSDGDTFDRAYRNIAIDMTSADADYTYYLPEVESMAGLVMTIRMYDRAAQKVTITQNTKDVNALAIIAGTGLVASIELDLTHEFLVLLSVGHFWVRLSHKGS